MSETVGDLLRRLKTTVGATKRRAILDDLPDEWYLAALEECKSLSGVRNKYHISAESLRIQMSNRNLPYDNRHINLVARAAYDSAEITDAFTDLLRMKYRIGSAPMCLDPNQAYGIMNDVHVPWFHRQRVDQFKGVCKTLGIRNMISVGDFYNLDILSRFALRDLEGLPKFWEELEAGRLLQEELGEIFDNRYLLLSNHEMRAHKAVAGKIEKSFISDWLFGAKIIETGVGRRELDHDYIVIGKGPEDPNGVRLVHPDKGQLYGFTKANDIARCCMQHVFIAHLHEFFLGYAWNGKRIGGLGMLADEQPYAERVSQKKKNSWGFYIYIPPDRMVPFTDGVVDWANYGCK